MIVFYIAMFLMVFVIILSVLLGSNNYKKNKDNVECFDQYVDDLKINSGAINSNLYNKTMLAKQDRSVYEFENSNMMQESIIYNTVKFDCKEVWVIGLIVI